MLQDTYAAFKGLTGKNGGDLAKRFNVSRQYIHQLKRNQSLTYKLAFYGMLSIIVDEKIEELKEHISNLEIVRNEMKADIDVCRCENEYYS